MKGIILIILCLFSLNLCAPENSDNIQKALLVETNLTKEELTQLLNSQSATNDISVEEVIPDSESETYSEKVKIFKNLKNGKLKIKIKLELDLNDKQKNQNETETESEGESGDGGVVKNAFIQTSVPEIPKKISFFNYILALLIMVILMSLFILSSATNKKNRKYILNKIKKNDDYLLKDN